MLLIVFIGAFLRIYNIEYQSLWNDELSSIMRSDKLSLTDIFSNWDDVHPPGQHVFMFFWIKLFGISEFSIRFPSVIAGILSIIAIFFLTKKLYSKNEAFISSALLAILWCPIYYSQEARQYSTVILFSILSSYFLIQIVEYLQNNQKIKTNIFVAFIVSSIILAFYHYFGLLLVAMQALYLLVISASDFRKLKKIILIYFFIFLAYLPWLSTLLYYINFDALPFMNKPTPIDFVYYSEFLFNWSEPLSKVVLVFYIFLFVLTIYRFFKVEKFKKYSDFLSKPEVILGLWLFVPILVVYVKSNISATIFSYRNLIISLPAAYILLARAITQIPIKKVFSNTLALILILLFLFDLIFNLNYYSKPTKEQFREISKYVVDNCNKYPNANLIACVNNKDYINYYFEKYFSKLKLENSFDENSDSLHVDSLLKIRTDEYFWYIQMHNIPQKSVLQYFQNHNILIHRENFIGGNVSLYKKKNQ